MAPATAPLKRPGDQAAAFHQPTRAADPIHLAGSTDDTWSVILSEGQHRIDGKEENADPPQPYMAEPVKRVDRVIEGIHEHSQDSHVNQGELKHVAPALVSGFVGHRYAPSSFREI